MPVLAGDELNKALHRLQSIRSPFPEDIWKESLEDYPDQLIVEQFLLSIWRGVDLRYTGPRDIRREAPTFVRDPALNKAIENEIVRQVKEGWVEGPFPKEMMRPYEHYIVSPMFGIPRTGGKWRIIHDLSKGPEPAVNTHIDASEFDIHYPTIDDVVETIAELRRQRPGAKIWLFKSDVASAFYHLVVRLFDRPLIVFEYNGYYFIRTTASMGGSSSPGLWNQVTELFKWILKRRYPISHAHTKVYVDDWLGFAIEQRERAVQAQASLHRMAAEHGIRMEPEKDVNPTQCLEFIGIGIDTEKDELRVPERKAAKALSLLESWVDKKRASAKQLQSLAGVLNDLCKVIRAGRRFLHFIITNMTRLRGTKGKLKLDDDFHKDIRGWIRLMQQWNCRAMLTRCVRRLIVDGVFTDAAGSHGVGGINLATGQWFYRPFSQEERALNIAVLEMYAVVCAAVIYGTRWRVADVEVNTDNDAIVEASKMHHYTKHPRLAALFRYLFEVEARGDFRLCFKHVPGVKNPIADAISRGLMSKMRQLWPEANRTGTYPPHIELITPAY